MGAPARGLTPDDVLRIQAERDDDLGYELVHGQLVPVMPASLPHGRIATFLGGQLDAFLRRTRLGRVYSEAGFVLDLPDDPDRLRGPDLAFVSHTTLDAAGGEPERGFFRGVPDLAIEIESPSDRKPGTRRRAAEYLEAGVTLVWTIHPQTRTAIVYRSHGSIRLLRAEESLDGEIVLPGFRLALAELFE